MEGIERRFTFRQEVPQIWFEFVPCKTLQITALVNLTINMSCMACLGTDKFLRGLNSPLNQCLGNQWGQFLFRQS